MLIILIRSIIIYFILVFGVRLMGKRTIGELQPYEFVIVLAIADMACIPLQDVSVSLLYGLVPLGVVILLHYVMTLWATYSIKFRKFLNGKPLIVIDEEGINSDCLTKLNMNVNDLLAMIRQQGYFSITQIKYGVIETNGHLSIMENEDAACPNSVPMTLVVEGNIMTENMDMLQITEAQIKKIIADHNYKLKDIVLMTADSNIVFIQPKKNKFFIVKV